VTWVRLDDSAASHPKFVQAGPEAFALWVAGLCYCNRYLTDGIIPKMALGVISAQFSAKQAAPLAKRLCTNSVCPDGLPSWIDAGDSFIVHDYASFQPSKVEVEAEKASARERQRRRRHGVTPIATTGVTPRVTFVEPDETVTRDARPPVPSRPVPSPETLRSLPCETDPAFNRVRGEQAENVWIGGLLEKLRSRYPRHRWDEGTAPRVLFGACRRGEVRQEGVELQPREISETLFLARIDGYAASDEWKREGGRFALRFETFMERRQYLAEPQAPGAQSPAGDVRRTAGAHETPQPSRVRSL
jgi:hypothetical protein